MRHNVPDIMLSALVEKLAEYGVPARLMGADRPIRGMEIDSRRVDPGNLFVCKGAGFQPAFLGGAVERGVAAYLCQTAVPGKLEVPSALCAASEGVPGIVVADVRRAMALVAPVVYGHPDRALDVVGITGTKGKSTVAYMLRAIFTAAGIESSVLGSIETDDGCEHMESHNTTPEAPDLWRHLRNTVDAGRRHMVMEVSSQGLKYDRVLGLHLDIACFLNIGRDHISSVEHPTFEDYFASKLRIFEQCGTAVVNLGTDQLDRVLAAASAGTAKRVVTVGVSREGVAPDWPVEPDFLAEHVVSTPKGLSFDVREHGCAGVAADDHGALFEHIDLGMPGLFNVDNALAAIAMARLLGVGYDAIRAGLAHVRVPGRMELVSSADGHVLAIVDYAHNELSFKTLFKSVKAEYPGRRVIALFGAPGGKAQERRRVLPQTAGRYADLLIYTEEDPAHDSVADICAEMVANTPEGVPCEVIEDREAAVRQTLAAALADERPSVVLLLAKGDETRQHRGDEYPEVTSDLALAREVLA